MNRSIIVEGWDGTGKSVLCDKLAKIFKMPVMHAGPPALDDDHAGFCTAHQLSWITRRPCIWHRVTPISRLCYQLSLHVTHQEYLKINLVHMLDYSIVVWCNVPNPHHKPGTHDDIAHLDFLERHEERIVKNYEKLMSNMPLNRLIEYNWQRGDTVGQLVTRIEELTR